MRAEAEALILTTIARFLRAFANYFGHDADLAAARRCRRRLPTIAMIYRQCDALMAVFTLASAFSSSWLTSRRALLIGCLLELLPA